MPERSSQHLYATSTAQCVADLRISRATECHPFRPILLSYLICAHSQSTLIPEKTLGKGLIKAANTMQKVQKQYGNILEQHTICLQVLEIANHLCSTAGIPLLTPQAHS
eukprot:1002028-Pelagomonas_calceolata.AAC.1